MTSLKHLSLGADKNLDWSYAAMACAKRRGYPKAQYAFDIGVVVDWLLWANSSRLNVSR